MDLEGTREEIEYMRKQVKRQQNVLSRHCAHIPSADTPAANQFPNSLNLFDKILALTGPIVIMPVRQHRRAGYGS